MGKKIGKCFLFSAGLIIVDIGCMTWLFGQDSLVSTALSLTVGIMSVILFFVVNYQMLTAEELGNGVQVKKLKDSDDYRRALQSYLGKPGFDAVLNSTMEQLESLERKGKTLNEVLYQNYGEEAEHFRSYQCVWEDAREMIYENIRRILNGMAVFDDQDYRRLRTQSHMTQLQQQKLDMYESQLTYLHKLVENNEQVLYEFDRLLLEVSKLSDKDTESELKAIQDVTESIRELRMEDHNEDLFQTYEGM